MRLPICIATCGILAATLTGGLSPAVAAQAANEAHPSARSWPSLAYDPALHELVLFGGTNWGVGPTSVFGDTWIRKNGGWTEEHPAHSPFARTGAAIVYDAATHQLLLFGGSGRPGTAGGYDDQTWLWTGTTWRELHPATSPPRRHNADMVYDAASHNVVLFGGYDGQYLNDTWTWNGTTWTQQHPADSPSPRDTFSMAYDAAAQNTVLFGGFNGSANLNDTWVWDGTNWTQLHPATSPSVRAAGWQSAYDAAMAEVVLFGGISTGDILQDTWTWNGSTWTQLQPATSPRGRENGAMTYDGLSREIILYGGDHGMSRSHLLGGPLWVWTGTTWTQL
jgi:hypothetical protein